MGFIVAVCILPVFFIMMLHNADMTKAKVEIAKLQEENKSLKKQLTESPFRRDHAGNG